MYLKCGLKQSLKCAIFFFFFKPYFCSNEDGLRNSGLSRIRTLTSAMPVQFKFDDFHELTS